MSDSATAAVDTNQVGIAGLVALVQSSADILIGQLPEHPDNHFGTPAMVAALGALADSFYAKYSERLEFNDMSLPLGGQFDIGRDWQPPHDEHRGGTNVDLRTWSRTAAQLRYIEERWRQASGVSRELAVHVESDPPHYHLRF